MSPAGAWRAQAITAPVQATPATTRNGSGGCRSVQGTTTPQVIDSSGNRANIFPPNAAVIVTRKDAEHDHRREGRTMTARADPEPDGRHVKDGERGQPAGCRPGRMDLTLNHVEGGTGGDQQPRVEGGRMRSACQAAQLAGVPPFADLHRPPYP